MTIKFTKQNTNYHHQNIVDLLGNVNDPVIQSAIHNPKQTIQVLGDIHRSQFLADNPDNLFWLRLRVYDETGSVIPGYEGIHIFVCFRLLQYSKNNYIMGPCITPPTFQGKDIADISQLFGFWEFRKMTTSFKTNIKQISTKQNPKRKRNPLKIIDPKTGKEI
jgi:hypothetical protein